MKDKTIEEIKTAVLQECEKVCPLPCSEWVKGAFRVTAWQSKWPQRWELYIRDRFDEWKTVATVSPECENANMIALFYSALGLESRDAVEAEREKVFDLLNKIASLERQLIASELDRVRTIESAGKLVDLLESLDNRFGYTKKKSDLSNFQGIKVPNEYHFLIHNAIEAHKKG